MNRILVDVGDLVDAATGTAEQENELLRALRGLADELNSALPEYEVGLLHLDTRQYLAFVEVDPTEGAFWADQAEQRRETAEAMLSPEED